VIFISRNLNIEEGKKLIKIGLNVAYYRKLKSLTQDELADKANISRTQLGHLEAPNMYLNPTCLTFIRIAEVLEVPLHVLTEIREDV